MTAILWMLGGAAAGAGVALILYVLGFGVELVNCACQILTCNCDGGDAIPGMWSGDSFLHVLSAVPGRADAGGEPDFRHLVRCG